VSRALISSPSSSILSHTGRENDKGTRSLAAIHLIIIIINIIAVQLHSILLYMKFWSGLADPCLNGFIFCKTNKNHNKYQLENKIKNLFQYSARFFSSLDGYNNQTLPSILNFFFVEIKINIQCCNIPIFTGVDFFVCVGLCYIVYPSGANKLLNLTYGSTTSRPFSLLFACSLFIDKK
jgi:hypothetical protein